MLIQRIQCSMNRVLEGLDRCEPHVILEASQEFTSATEELKKNAAAFYEVCNQFDELSVFAARLQDIVDQLNEIDMNDVPDSYSFTDHAAMQGAKIRDGNYLNPEYIVSTAALEYPTYVAAVQDAVLAIAQWCEQFPEVFSVGKKGIMFTQQMSAKIKNEKLRVRDFCSDDELGILSAILGETQKEEDELKAEFKDLWLPADTPKEKEDEAWDKFTSAFSKIGESGKAAFDEARNAIKNTEPPDQVQDQGKKSGGLLKGLLGSIFGGGGNDTKIEPIGQNPDSIIGQSLTDNYGVFNMTFVDLQSLITKVIEFAGTSAESSAAALDGIDKQNKEVMKPSDSQTKLIDLLKDSEYKFDQEQIATIGLALEEAGMKDGDWKSVDKTKAKEELLKVFEESEGKSDKTDAVMKLLYASEDDADSFDVDELRNELEGLDIDDDFSDGLASLLDSLVDDDGNPKEELDASDVEAKIDEIEPDGESLPDDFKNDLINLLSDEQVEENVYRRWSKLAGILKS